VISNPFTDPKWADKTLRLIDRMVGFVRDKTTRPLANLLRAIVFGVILIVAGLLIFIFGLIGLVRAFNEFFDLWLTRPTAVWVSYFLLSLMFTGLGALMMRKRHQAPTNSKSK
jgi:phosphoglycerol transferase MdoB-like AlkP superfamily enzyme